MALFTIGYEGRALDDVLGRLTANRIDMVVDVRALPLSRKRGFSKKALAAALNQVGIAYEHRVALGTPKSIRARYKRDHDVAALTTQFTKYLAGQTHSLLELIDLVKGNARAFSVSRPIPRCATARWWPRARANWAGRPRSISSPP